MYGRMPTSASGARRPVGRVVVVVAVYSRRYPEDRMSRTSLTELLQLTSSPVAIAFVDAPPPGVQHVSAIEPAGCGYWRRAAEGEVFFTTADDHKGCPVGAHTHASRALAWRTPGGYRPGPGDGRALVHPDGGDPEYPDAEDTISRGGLRADRRHTRTADVVLIRANARQLMLLTEAARAAGVAGTGGPMGRPTCAVLPEAINRREQPRVWVASATASTPAPMMRRPTSPFPGQNSAPSKIISR